MKQETASSGNIITRFIASLTEGPTEKVQYRKLRAIDESTLRDVGLDRWKILMPAK